ncbi:MAG: biopolymer transporter ExbD [Myxococcota bacterium]
MFVTSNRRRRIRERLAAVKHRQQGEVKSDINVTPLVDVVLVLLIIFMVVTPMIAGGVPVELPKTAHHNRKPDDGKDIIISVTTDKRVYVSGKPLTGPKEVTRWVEEERRKHPEKAAFVKGDARATYGVVREVMEAVHRAGMDNVMLGTDEIKDKP